MAVRARELRFAASVDRLGALSRESGEPLPVGEEWTPEHLLLAALVRCSIASLRFHVERAGGDVLASGEARGLVTRREQDDRFAFVEIEVTIAAELEPEPADLGALLERAARDCFVGASLAVKPSYRWRVNAA